MGGEGFFLAARFAAFSVSASNKAAVVRYIRTQDAHHKKMHYVSELIALLKKHGVAIRPKICFRLACAHAYGAHDPTHTLPTQLKGGP
jgi:hypothetical protein